MEVDATPQSPVSSVLVGISSDVTLGRDRVVVLVIAVKGTKLNPRKWVKKCEPQVGELDQPKLKTDVLHGNQDGGVHMTQPLTLGS